MIPKVLIFYKKSAYRIYFEENKPTSMDCRQADFIDRERKRFKKAHAEHYKTLEKVEGVLKALQIDFTRCYRGQHLDFLPYNLVITIGGDGTFLEAARLAESQIILGVNSAPSYSIGKLCMANANTFEMILKAFLAKNVKLLDLRRLRITHVQKNLTVEALNDVLICHKNPAAMSRYYLGLGRVVEEQRSSGIWVATSSGSTGAICSAGGQQMNKQDHQIQYLPRELYQLNQPYKLSGGFLNFRQILTITSLMRQGRLFIDGVHYTLPFGFGQSVKLSVSPSSTRIIQGIL